VAAGHRAAAAQGAAFGAEAWRLSGAAPGHAETAVRVLTGTTPAVAADWTWTARRDLTGPGRDANDYRDWRLRIQRLSTADRVSQADTEEATA
jgi:hypothetical protein